MKKNNMTFIKKTIKELEELSFNIEGGKLEGCKVYHEAVKQFLTSALQECRNNTLEEVREKLMEQDNYDYVMSDDINKILTDLKN